VDCFFTKNKKFFRVNKIVNLIKIIIKNKKTNVKILQKVMKNAQNMVINIIKINAK